MKTEPARSGQGGKADDRAEPLARPGGKGGAAEPLTVLEAAEALGISPGAVKKHVRELWPNLMRRGKTTRLNEAHITWIQSRIEEEGLGYTELQAKIEGLQAENARLAEVYGREALARQAAEERLAEREAGLAMIQRLAEAGGILVSDREDGMAVYGGKA